jgi:hypothetical protein
MPNNNRPIRPRFKLIRFDEREFWSEEIQAKTLHIWSVYVYDMHRHVHICSFEPTYEARFLYTEMELIPYYYEDGKEDERDALEETIRHENSLSTHEWDYYYPKAMDRAPRYNKSTAFVAWGKILRDNDNDREAAYFAAIEEIAEYESGNPTFC